MITHLRQTSLKTSLDPRSRSCSAIRLRSTFNFNISNCTSSFYMVMGRHLYNRIVCKRSPASTTFKLAFYVPDTTNSFFTFKNKTITHIQMHTFTLDFIDVRTTNSRHALAYTSSFYEIPGLQVSHKTGKHLKKIRNIHLILINSKRNTINQWQTILSSINFLILHNNN